MEKQYTYKPVALRFRRWSRKAYAAFISIQRVVNIGNLTANVSERFQVKNGAIHTSILSFGCPDNGETTEEEVVPGEWLRIASALWQTPALLFMQTIQQPAVAAPAHTSLIDNISERAEGFS